MEVVARDSKGISYGFVFGFSLGFRLPLYHDCKYSQHYYCSDHAECDVSEG